jgi:hypothetical protein
VWYVFQDSSQPIQERIVKKAIGTMIFVCFFVAQSFCASYQYPNVRVNEIRRESASKTCLWSDHYLLIKVSDSGSSKWLRLAETANGYKDMLTILLTAATTGLLLRVVYEPNTDPCSGAAFTPVPSDGILESVSLLAQ